MRRLSAAPREVKWDAKNISGVVLSVLVRSDQCRAAIAWERRAALLSSTADQQRCQERSAAHCWHPSYVIFLLKLRCPWPQASTENVGCLYTWCCSLSCSTNVSLKQACCALLCWISAGRPPGQPNRALDALSHSSVAMLQSERRK